MPKQKILFIKLSIFTSLIFVFSSKTLIVGAESLKPINPKLRFVAPQISHAGRPAGRRRGGANRGDCPASEKRLTAIVPQTVIRDKGDDPILSTWESVGGLTSVPNPSLLFYVPDELTKFTKDFVLQDESGTNIYKTSLTPSSTGSNFIQQRISPTAVTLKPGKVYQWFFVVNCDPDAAPYVQGWIQRVTLSPSLKSQLQKATLLQQAYLYASNGIWYDALNALAEGRRAKEQDANLLSSWISLLDSVGLKAIATEPISGCCKPKQITNNNSKPISQ